LTSGALRDGALQLVGVAKLIEVGGADALDARHDGALLKQIQRPLDGAPGQLSVPDEGVDGGVAVGTVFVTGVEFDQSEKHQLRIALDPQLES
jgi:hypothetical protein